MTVSGDSSSHPNAPLEHKSHHDGHWLPLAVVHTLAGSLLGLLTAALLVVLSLQVFPGLADFDYDIGLRMERFAAERWNSFPTSILPTQKPKEKAGEAPVPDSYLFLDVDPQAESPPVPGASSASVDACRALAARHAARYAVSAETPEEAGATADVRTSLECGDDRPVNRHLLAELVKDLRERGARVIVLDVEIAGTPGGLPSAEYEALQAVLKQFREKAAPVVYARPAAYDVAALHAGDHIVQLSAVGDFGAGSRPSAIPAIALPEPDQPLRRYARCFRIQIAGTDVPSLPYLASLMMDDPQFDASKACASRPTDDPAPRIHYTLPSLRSHQDATGRDEDFRRWSIYRNIYNRCTVPGFWSPASECSGKAMVAGKMVVIGASNPARRDRHYTPLGDMAGAEVVINAARSFAQYPLEKDKSVWEALKKKAYIVFICMFVWFAFFCFKGLVKPAKEASLATRAGRSLAVGVAFCLALVAVLLLTFHISFLSLSVLVGVMAIGVEQYVEMVTAWIIHPFERFLKKLLHLPLDHA